MGHDASIAPGAGGQFDVLAEGELVFSKGTAGRFPADGEVAGLLAAR